MDIRKKDNFTDLVEWADKQPRSEENQPLTDSEGNHQAITSSGEIVTLGQKEPSGIKKKSFELSEGLRASLSSAFQEKLDKIFQKNQQDKEK
jgi:hypothetical protein